MLRELYFDIGSEHSGGSLYRIKDEAGNFSFQFQHSTYDSDKDDIKVYETTYPSFSAFWQMLTKYPQWFYQHPLFVHPEQGDFIKEQLQQVNWAVHSNKNGRKAISVNGKKY